MNRKNNFSSNLNYEQNNELITLKNSLIEDEKFESNDNEKLILEEILNKKEYTDDNNINEYIFKTCKTLENRLKNILYLKINPNQHFSEYFTKYEIEKLIKISKYRGVNFIYIETDKYLLKAFTDYDDKIKFYYRLKRLDSRKIFIDKVKFFEIVEEFLIKVRYM